MIPGGELKPKKKEKKKEMHLVLNSCAINLMVQATIQRGRLLLSVTHCPGVTHYSGVTQDGMSSFKVVTPATCEELKESPLKGIPQ